jgi:hypothetical protein
MSLDQSLLKKVKPRGGKVIAQCPVCAAGGGDKKGEHLVIFEGGPFACIAHEGDGAHRKEIHAMVGNKPEKQEQNGRNQKILERTHRYEDAQGEHLFDELRCTAGRSLVYLQKSSPSIPSLCSEPSFSTFPEPAGWAFQVARTVPTPVPCPNNGNS